MSLLSAFEALSAAPRAVSVISSTRWLQAHQNRCPDNSARARGLRCFALTSCEPSRENPELDDGMGKHRQPEASHEGAEADPQPFWKPVVRLPRGHSFRWIGRVGVGVLVGACRLFAKELDELIELPT